MSKYIRTKDGKIYELQKTKSGEKYLVKTNELIPEWNEAREVIKQADTIEELCDEFICENSLIDSSPIKENGRIIDRYSKLDNAIMLAKKDLIVYGAIWTDKGLIYRAKMNEKGELELL